jgi:hypothetical protein
VYKNDNLSIKQPPVSQAAKEKAVKSRAARGHGGTEGDNDKVPCTSKFHFSKGKYGNVVLAWHGVLVQKAKNFSDICAQARNIFRATDVVGKGQLTQTVDPEIRTRVGLDSESESDRDKGDDEDEDLQDYVVGDDDNNWKGKDREDDGLENTQAGTNSYYDNDGDDDVDGGNDGDDDVDGGNDGNEEVQVDCGGPSRRSSRTRK